jgi:hypothetical protein
MQSTGAGEDNWIYHNTNWLIFTYSCTFSHSPSPVISTRTRRLGGPSQHNCCAGGVHPISAALTNQHQNRCCGACAPKRPSFGGFGGEQRRI